MAHNTSHPFSHRMIGVLIALILLLTACAVLTNAQAPTAIVAESVQATSTPAATCAPTCAPTAVAEPTIPAQSVPSVTVDVSGVAQQVASLEVSAVLPGPDVMGRAVMPQYTLLWLYGYTITGHQQQPEIFVFAVDELGVNAAAAKAAQDLQTLLQTQQPGDPLPFLPLSGYIQALHAQVQYLDFKNGKGMRYLTQFNNGLAPINDHALFYTFQGLTGDGKYYVSAVLPVYLPSLPMYPTDTAGLPQEFTDDYPAYIASIVNQLNLEPASSYTPDLSQLDALVESIEIK